jgi:antitoxin HigA-1
MNKYGVFDENGNEITTNITLHPGEIIELELNARGIKKNFFASQLNIKPNQLSELIHEKRHVSAVMALKLEVALGIKAEYWLRVQSAYDLAKAREIFQQRVAA